MDTLTEAQKHQLDTDGYVLLPQVLTPTDVIALTNYLEMLWQTEGEQAGAENYIETRARRLANLANKGDIFRAIFAHRLILAGVAHVMGPNIHLSMLNARDALPHADDRQPFHCDTDNSGKPDALGYSACTAVWMLDDFTVENGATRFVPGSHLSHKVPKEVMADIFAPHPNELSLTGQRGDVLVFNGHCWHAGGQNQSDGTRRAILAHYLRADIPRSADRRQHISPEVQARVTPAELAILGVDVYP